MANWQAYANKLDEFEGLCQTAMVANAINYKFSSKVEMDLLLNSVTLPDQMSNQCNHRRFECDHHVADAELDFAV